MLLCIQNCAEQARESRPSLHDHHMQMGVGLVAVFRVLFHHSLRSSESASPTEQTLLMASLMLPPSAYGRNWLIQLCRQSRERCLGPSRLHRSPISWPSVRLYISCRATSFLSPTSPSPRSRRAPNILRQVFQHPRQGDPSPRRRSHRYRARLMRQGPRGSYRLHSQSHAQVMAIHRHPRAT